MWVIFYLRPYVKYIFRMSILTKLPNAQRHNVEIFSTEFHSDRSRQMESRGINPFIPLIKVWPKMSRLSQNSSLLTAFRKEFFHRFPQKSDKWFIPWYKITDTRTVGVSTYDIIFSVLKSAQEYKFPSDSQQTGRALKTQLTSSALTSVAEVKQQSR